MKIMQGQSISYHSKMPKTFKIYGETFVVGSHLVWAHYSRPAAMECIMARACGVAKLYPRPRKE